MTRTKFGVQHVALLLGMAALFVGHVFVVGSASSYAFGLPQWYWAVTGVSALLYFGVAALIRDLAANDPAATEVTNG